MFDGVCYGLLLGLVVFSTVMLLVFRESIYVWYLVSCLGALLALAGFNGHTLRYPFAHWPAAAGFFYAVAPPLWAISKLMFGRSLLRLAYFAPRLDKVVLAMVAALAVATVYGLLGANPLWLFRMVQVSVVLATVVLAAGAVMAMRRPLLAGGDVLRGRCLAAGGHLRHHRGQLGLGGLGAAADGPDPGRAGG